MAWLRFIGKVLIILVMTVPLTIMALMYLSKLHQSRREVLQGIAIEAKQQLDEAMQTAAVEAKAARDNEIELKLKLEHIKAIGDKRKRREELLRLYQEAIT